jgi:molecular chaperone DnaK (HSP70)
VRYWLGLIALFLIGCAHTDGASVLVESGASAISPDGTLRESIGIETLGGVFTPLLAKGCKVPCSLSQNFSTAEDGQGQILLRLFRGDAVLAKSTHSLGNFQITGISAAPRGEPSIGVEFKADEDGITLRAVDNNGRSRLSIVRVTR